MRLMFKSLLAAVVALLSIATAADTRGISREDALSAVASGVCDRSIVLLGEESHGDGATETFKVALVQRLVRSCGFNAIAFEASHYDFVEISRRLRENESVTPDMVASAVGWIRGMDAEFEPLIPFLYSEATSGRLVLDGLDDQLGGRNEFYSLGIMPDELASFLSGPERDTCRALLRTDTTDNAHLGRCAAEIGAAAAGRRDLTERRREEITDLLDNIARLAARLSDDKSRYVADRDRSMWLNLQRLANRLPAASKIIVWTSTAHAAKDGVALDPAYTLGPNLGRSVSAAYGSKAFTLGFSAVSGAFAWSSTEARHIPSPPPDALEAKVMTGPSGAAVYAGPAALRALGRLPAALSFYSYKTVDIAEVLDGVVVFQAEYPPTLAHRP